MRGVDGADGLPRSERSPLRPRRRPSLGLPQLGARSTRGGVRHHLARGAAARCNGPRGSRAGCSARRAAGEVRSRREPRALLTDRRRAAAGSKGRLPRSRRGGGGRSPAQLPVRDASVGGEPFRRSAVVDIDPGLLQTWLLDGEFELAAHDLHFTIGENDLPDVGVDWEHTPPCVSLDWWSPHPAANGTAAFTTVTHWHGPQWVGDLENGYCNEKRLGFLPFLDLAERVPQPLELALPREEEEAGVELRRRGWRVRSSQEVAGTPWDYQRYVQSSLGEFSCAKPSAVLLQNAWISDRTLCYLASGKPAVIQHTGPSDFLPDAEGIFRFRTLEEAAAAFEDLAADYERHCGSLGSSPRSASTRGRSSRAFWSARWREHRGHGLRGRRAACSGGPAGRRAPSATTRSSSARRTGRLPRPPRLGRRWPFCRRWCSARSFE